VSLLGGLTVIVFCSVLLAGCQANPPIAAPGTPVDLIVPLRSQSPVDYYCVPACILMWHDYRNGYDPFVTNDAIWNWMESYSGFPDEVNPWWPGGGVHGRAAAVGATHFVNEAISTILSLNPQVGLERVEVSLRSYAPIMVWINEGTHVVIARGMQYSRLNEPMQRPVAELVKVNDPLNGTISFSPGQLMNLMRNSGPAGTGRSQLTMKSELVNVQGYLQAFDSMGGTYLGPQPGGPGRYKFNGDGACYWDAADDGANQCGPPSLPTGRYKWDGLNCYWDQNESGVDQCTPSPQPAGRYKWDGRGCAWDPNDSGPNQCEP
jgi:hypothetical protein